MTDVASLTPDLIDCFRSDGFVVVPDVLTESELARFGRPSMRAWPDEPATTPGGWPRSHATSSPSFNARTSGRTAPTFASSPSTRG